MALALCGAQAERIPQHYYIVIARDLQYSSHFSLRREK